MASQVFAVQELVINIHDFAGDHVVLQSSTGVLNQWLGVAVPQLSFTIQQMVVDDNGVNQQPVQPNPQEQ